jgi:hypothetical protein
LAELTVTCANAGPASAVLSAIAATDVPATRRAEMRDIGRLLKIADWPPVWRTFDEEVRGTSREVPAHMELQ